MSRYAVCVAVAVLLAGCQSTNLQAEKGSAAIAFSTQFDIDNGRRFPCNKISFELLKKSGEELISAGREQFFPSENESVQLLAGIVPGEYKINEIRCHAESGWEFNSGKSYLKKEVAMELLLESDVITIADKGFLGDSKVNNSGNSRFFYSLESIDSKSQAEVKAWLQQTQDLNGWTVKM